MVGLEVAGLMELAEPVGAEGSQGCCLAAADAVAVQATGLPYQLPEPGSRRTVLECFLDQVLGGCH